ncbi:response regulator transcription factor [Terracoccus luteus]|uniref:Two-component system KDP operon response regulator KdpE n=1 Tax=Terracoccus luteus TaxID=53356 RepID=A0A495XSY2_9MICO|nr:response regulator transcription factor [Terracoccus luteus]MBB2985121.1 two-component system KDP operon response regulator KdpE [Terracoccus luteus]MCP2170773.1 two-component system KDP operon response regulator KdpE [Terracoccus luteus]RKT77620.1 two-component system KDP operon response regulator KdpE [Terracoccus luteus]
MSRVLVVDDDPRLQRTLSIALRAHSHEVLTAADGRTALQVAAEDEPDVVILDLGLPDLDGTEVLSRLRQTSAVPVIVLSARHESEDKVEALDLGADDFVTKPFGVEELLARVRAAVRRGGDLGRSLGVLENDHFRLDFSERRARVDGADVRFTPTEWRVLETLCREPGHLVSQQDLLRSVWGPSYGRESNYLRVYANQLRRKLEPDPAHPQHLLTEPGLGYRFVP